MLLELEEIYKRYNASADAENVLKGINLSIDKGELVALMGASGSGKSTLMNIFGLLDKPSAGSYKISGKDTATLSSDAMATIRNATIGFVFQQFFLLPRLNVIENITLPLSYAENKTLNTDYAYTLLEKVGLGNYAQRMPNELSGGQQQRVAIARALVCEPEVILADEPTGALDSKTSDEVMDLLTGLQHDNHKTLIIVTHDQQVANRCQRVVHLRDGIITHEQSQ